MYVKKKKIRKCEVFTYCHKVSNIWAIKVTLGGNKKGNYFQNSNHSLPLSDVPEQNYQ